MKKYMVSLFKAPVWNKLPLKEISLFWVWMYVTMKYLQFGPDPDFDIALVSKTEYLRRIEGNEAQRQYKGKNFDYITPAGTYTRCDDNSRKDYSGMLCMDCDHLDDDSDAMKRKISPEEMKKLLLDDPYWGERTLMMFTSPRGHGVKWFVEIDLGKCDYATWFKALRNYLLATYGFGEKQIDSTVSNESHACFISYDPDAYLRPDLYEFYI